MGKLVPDLDDKDLVIIAVTIITVCALYVLTDPIQIVSQAITGLFGVAVGKSLK